MLFLAYERAVCGVSLISGFRQILTHAPADLRLGHQPGRNAADRAGVSTPIDRLPYADCAYIEATLSPADAGHGADVAAANDAAAPCPTCQRDRRTGTLSTEALDVLQFRFWSADHRVFDHIGFARAVLAACAH